MGSRSPRPTIPASRRPWRCATRSSPSSRSVLPADRSGASTKNFARWAPGRRFWCSWTLAGKGAHVPPVGLALIALGGVCLIGPTIRRPTRTIIPLYAALVPIGGVFRLSIPLTPPFNTLSSLVGPMAILGTVAHIVLYRRARIPSTAVAAWLIFMSWSVLSVFWARLPSATMQDLLIALPLISLMVVVGLLPTDGMDVSLVQIAIVASGAVIGTYALVLLLRGSALPVHGTQE